MGGGAKGMLAPPPKLLEGLPAPPPPLFLRLCFMMPTVFIAGIIANESHVSPSTDSRGTVVSYWQKYVHEVLVNRLGGLSLPRKSVVRLSDRPDMTLVV